jgi:hypothetical protein
MNDYPATAQLTSVTIVLPVMNESVSLKQTVEIILACFKTGLLTRFAPRRSILKSKT